MTAIFIYIHSTCKTRYFKKSLTDQKLSKRGKNSGYFDRKVMQILYCIQFFVRALATHQNLSFGHGIDIHKLLFPSVAMRFQKFSGWIVRTKFLSPFHYLFSTWDYICLFLICFSEVCICQANYKTSLVT